LLVARLQLRETRLEISKVGALLGYNSEKREALISIISPWCDMELITHGMGY